jgi:glycosidase
MTTRLILIFALSAVLANAQDPRVTKVEPPYWWTGMRLDTLELMVYGGPFDGAVSSSADSGIHIIATNVPTNVAYAFIQIRIAPTTRPGIYPIRIRTMRGSTEFLYSLHAREDRAGRYQGFGPEDVVYLIMPDRFANGDTSNDSVPGLRERVNRASPLGRHGGDIKGIIGHLDYLKNLGVTALWINPLIENDNPFASYHGYAATDLYRIDPRFGTNDLYRTLVDEAHRRGLKIIMDHVCNHISIFHPWIKGLPSPDWLNGTVENHLPISHLKGTLNDVQSDPTLRLNVIDGWFSHSMPDLNQCNPQVARYLLQSTLWWIESSGIDGIREDTYPYVDQAFLNRWCGTILSEYPRFNIVGEVWINEPPFTASFQRGNRLVPSRNAQLPTVTDFPLYEALKAAIRNNGSIASVATCISMDFCYAAPESLLTFVDNHDVPRIALVTDSDFRRMKLAFTVLLTTRGIPQILYGTELAMRGGREDGLLRADMPGGFPGDDRNAFTDSGRTREEREWFSFIRNLMHLRQSHPSLARGALVHFPPNDELYVYFRVGKESTFLIVVNNSDRTRSLLPDHYRRYIPLDASLLNISGDNRKTYRTDVKFEIGGLSAEIFEVIPHTQ